MKGCENFRASHIGTPVEAPSHYAPVFHGAVVSRIAPGGRVTEIMDVSGGVDPLNIVPTFGKYTGDTLLSSAGTSLASYQAWMKRESYPKTGAIARLANCLDQDPLFGLYSPGGLAHCQHFVQEVSGYDPNSTRWIGALMKNPYEARRKLGTSKQMRRVFPTSHPP